jgi:enoyl-CoA hydratase/carnithine racemase
MVEKLRLPGSDAAGVRALVLHSAGKHFCADLDLAELSNVRGAGVAHSPGWHRVFDRIQFGRVPGRCCWRGGGRRAGTRQHCAPARC